MDKIPGILLLLAAALVPAPAEPAPARDDAAQPRWQWSLEQVEGAVGKVRAGCDLTPPAWPENARVAVLLSFDVDTETLSLMYGDATVTEFSQGEYGARRGMQRIMALLDRHRIPASFFIPAVSLRLHPGLVQLIRRPGIHEIGVHGWIHEDPAAMEPEREREFLERAIATITELTGERPVGYRAPSWIMSPDTPRLIEEAGFLYDSSMMADDRPYELLYEGRPLGLVELPVDWILDDYPVLSLDSQTHLSPAEVLDIYIAEFDRARAEGTMFLLTMHPQIIGHRSRIGILERLIAHIRAAGGAWFATHRDAARYVIDRHHAPSPSATRPARHPCGPSVPDYN